MTRTRSSYIPHGVVTRGLGAVAPSGGVGRASRGLVQDFPHGVVPPPDVGHEDPPRLLSTITQDSQGVQRLLSDDILSVNFAHAGQELFANPDREYTGYAANGFWYTAGVIDPTHTPFQASWASEPSGDNRGVLDRFPARLIIVATRKEVALFDADSLDVWMRFLIAPTLPAFGDGMLAGQPSTVIRSVRYTNGFLIIATNEGLRVANFRLDQGVLVLTIRMRRSATGLVNRNEDLFLFGSQAVPIGGLLQNENCLSMDAGSFSVGLVTGGSTKRNRTVAAVGHPDGITAVQLGVPGVYGVSTAKHSSLLAIPTGWEAEDEGTGSSYTSLFVDNNFGATQWANRGVRPGDVIEADVGPARTIIRVEQLQPGRRLWVTPELALTETGASYQISKSVPAVLLSPELHLYFANGLYGLAVVRDLAWIETDDFIFSDLNVAGDSYSEFTAAVSAVNDLAKRGNTLYAATSIGVFRTTDDDLNDKRTAPFLYSTEAVTAVEATYRILFGDEANCIAIEVDPETGNIMVAVTEFESVVTEINPNIQHAFRFFDNVGRVKSLVSYRNPTGPPDEDPEEAT